MRRLPSRSFLVLGCLGKRSTWQLPYRDVEGRVNVELLAAARAKVLGAIAAKEGKGGSKPIQKEVAYAAKLPEIKTKLDKLWLEARRASPPKSSTLTIFALSLPKCGTPTFAICPKFNSKKQKPKESSLPLVRQL